MNKKPTNTPNTSENMDSHMFSPSTTLQPVGSRTLSKLTITPPTELWGSYICSGQLGMAFGWRGIGKSTFAMALALSMATGKTFLDSTPGKKSKVIILDGEMDLHTIQNRLKLISSSLDVSLTDRLKFISPEFYSGAMPKLHTPEGQKKIDDALGLNWDVLIVDNYSCFSSGREDADAWAPWLPWLLSHKRAGRTVIIVHHTGKNGTQRGASNHEDPMDFVISLRPPKSSPADDSLEFVISWTKSRHLSPSQTKPIQVALTKNEKGTHEWLKRPQVDTNLSVEKAKALKAKGLNITEIAKELGMNKSTVSRWLSAEKS